MKVQITADAKKWLSLEKAPIAREIVLDMKSEDTESVEEVLMRAAYAYQRVFLDRGERCELGYAERVLEAKAEIAQNGCVHD